MSTQQVERGNNSRNSHQEGKAVITCNFNRFSYNMAHLAFTGVCYYYFDYMSSCGSGVISQCCCIFWSWYRCYRNGGPAYTCRLTAFLFFIKSSVLSVRYQPGSLAPLLNILGGDTIFAGQQISHPFSAKSPLASAHTCPGPSFNTIQA